MMDEYGFDDPGVPIQPLVKDKPKGLVTRKEFWPLLEEYQKLAADPKTGVQTLGERAQKISDFLEEYTSKLLNSSASTTRKVSFLQKFDSRMNSQGPAIAQKYYSGHGLMHISAFLKLSFYKELSLDQDAEPLNYNDPEVISQLEKMPLEKKTNRIIDSIVAQIIKSSSSKELFLAMCDWMIEERRTTHKVIRIIMIFTNILADIKKKRAKFLQGFLYTFGCMLKAEAFSYLKTIFPPEKFIHIDQYVDNNERRFVRELDKDEVEVFEKYTPRVLIKFFESLIEPECMKNAIVSTKLDYLYNITRREFIDEYDNDHKKRPTLINPIEAGHYSYLFGLDTLAFYFCFMLKEQEEVKPIETKDRIELKNLIENPTTLTHTSFKYQFIINHSEELVSKIVEILHEICKDPLTILRLNKLHLAGTAPSKVLPTRKGQEDPSYERTSTYNQVGIALYSYLLLYTHRTLPLFPIFITKEYLFELYLPSIAALLSVKSTGRFGIQLLHRFIVKEKIELEKYEMTSGFLEVYMGMLLELINFVGRGDNELLQYMGFVLFPILMKMLPADILVTVIQKLLQKLDADGARGMVIDRYKEIILKLKENEQLPYDIKSIIEKLFEKHATDIQSNILENKETLHALLALYKVLIMKDKKNRFGVMEDKKFQESMRSIYMEPINEVVKIIMGEEVKAENVKLPEEIIGAYKKERNQLDLFRFLIADIEQYLSILNNK